MAKIEINSVLCYVSTARHSKTDNEIANICLGFYSGDLIKDAKDLIYKITNDESIRRRGTNRMWAEIQDVIDALRKCDEKGIDLPTFVADSYDSLPPSTGFEIIASTLNSLMEEVITLRDEIKELKTLRSIESMSFDDLCLMKGDLLEIKGMLRMFKTNNEIDSLRRKSLELSDNVKNIDFNYTNMPDINDLMSKICVPSAPPLSQENSEVDMDILYNRLDGGDDISVSNGKLMRTPLKHFHVDNTSDTFIAPNSIPHINMESNLKDVNQKSSILIEDEHSESPLSSKPAWSQVVSRPPTLNSLKNSLPLSAMEEAAYTQDKDESVEERVGSPKVPAGILSSASLINQEMANDASSRTAKPSADTKEEKDQRPFSVDSEGFQMARSRTQKRKESGRVVGNGKMRGLLRSAPRSLDLFVGQCDNNVDFNIIKSFVKNDCKINVIDCVEMKTFNKFSKSFKVTVNACDRDKLLVSELWPQGIVCKKFLGKRS